VTLPRGPVAKLLGTPSAWSRRSVWGPAVLGLAGIVAIVVSACLPGSPFSLQRPDAWFFGVPTSPGPVRPGPALRVLELAGGFGGLVVLARSWLALLRAARTPQVPVKVLARVFGAWMVPLLVAPPLFSTYVYSYAAQGEMVSWHISPYLYGPSVLGVTPFATLSHGVWSSTASPYGPLFLGLAGGLVRLAGHQVLRSLILFRLLTVAGVVLAAACVPSLARRHGCPPGPAFVLGAMNPLILLFVVGSAHNDGLLLGLVTAGVLLASHRRWLPAILLCTLAAAVKAPGLLPLGYVVWSWLHQAPGRWAALRRGALAVATVGGTFLVLDRLTGLGWGWLRNLGAPGEVFSWTTPVDLGATAVHSAVGWVGIDASTGHVVSAMHVVGLVAAAAVATALWWRSRALDLTAIGASLVVFALLGPTAQPWYLTWGLPLLAAGAGRRWQAWLAWGPIVVVFVDLLDANTLIEQLRHVGPIGSLLVLAIVLSLAGFRPRPSSPRGTVVQPSAPTALATASALVTA